MDDKLQSKDITQLIKYMREASGYSQTELAKMLGIAQTTLSGYETGYSEPNFTLVEKIARLCDFEMLVLDKSSDEMIRITDKKQ